MLLLFFCPAVDLILFFTSAVGNVLLLVFKVVSCLVEGVFGNIEPAGEARDWLRFG